MEGQSKILNGVTDVAILDKDRPSAIKGAELVPKLFIRCLMSGTLRTSMAF